MPCMAARGPIDPPNRREDDPVDVVLPTGSDSLFSDPDDAEHQRTVPGSYSPCDCIGQRGEVDEIRRLIATARATLARAMKG